RALLHRRFIDELCDTYPEIATGVAGRLRVRALPCLRRVIGFDLDAARGGVEPPAALADLAADGPGAPALAVGAEISPADDAVLVYTSGTTAQPKAVLHAHRAPAIQAHHFAASMLLSPDDRLWTTQPFFWVAGLAVSLGATLVAGATLVLDETF